MTDAISAIGTAAAKSMGHVAVPELHVYQPLNSMPRAANTSQASTGMRADLTATTEAVAKMMMKADPQGEALHVEHQRLMGAPASLDNYQHLARVEVELARHSAEGFAVFHLASSLSMSVMESFKSLLHAPN